MKYKALMIDVDGTLIPNRADGMPSKKVTKAVGLAAKLLHVGVASSRPLFLLPHIFDHLKLSGPSIINGGAQIVNITSQKIYYRQPLETADIGKVYEIAKKNNVPLYADTDDKEILVTEDLPKEEILGMYIPALDQDLTEKLRKLIDGISNVSVHIAPSWTKGMWTISVSHTRATKQHAIFEIAKILKISTDDIIGVGDGGNDFPLLMGCGLKVAMGNAVEDIKAIADYIAPSVEEDGLVDVINKFVLN